MKEQNGTTSPLGASSDLNKQPHGLHLACRECQRKKIRCDRTYPCGQCSRAGLSCVQSTRKPRAKAGNKAADAELRQRIAKLEKLVETFQGEDAKDATLRNSASPRDLASRSESSSEPLAPQHRTSSDSPASNSETGSVATSKYVAGTFWSSLTTEVKALADAFEEDDDASDCEESSPSDASPPQGPFSVDPNQPGLAGHELILCPPGAIYIMPGALLDPDPTAEKHIFEWFLQYVDPMYKIFHVPTLVPFMTQNRPYLRRSPDAACNKALRASIHFAGVLSMTEDECQAKCGKSLAQTSQEYRRMVDIALHNADVLNTNELATLQALMLYISSVRVVDSSRRAWSLLGLLVRIARGMNIHVDTPGETPFLAELRRRLWYNVVFLDCYASHDRGSEPMIHPDQLTRALPAHVNDNDFDHNSVQIPTREGEITDTTLSLVALTGSVLAIHLAAPSDDWRKRLEMVYEYQRNMQDRFFRYCAADNPYHTMIMQTGIAICHSSILRAVRPMSSLSRAPPPVDSPWVMQLAMNILRNSDDLYQIHAGQWRKMPWVPWHAIAVTLAGLCSNRGTEFADEAWQLVDRAMSRYAKDVADSKNGMLWQPLEKLRKKAEAFRDAVDQQGTSPLPNAQTIPFDGAATAVSETSFQPDFNFNLNNSNATLLDPMAVPLADNVFDFPPEMQAALPVDNSWLDWEAMMKDMDELKADVDMQWV